MKWVLATVAAAAIAGSASGQSAEDLIDYPALFEAHAGQVEELMTTPGRSRLQLVLGEVVVWADGEDGARRYSAMDRSQAGAVGCLWQAYLEVAQMSRACPDMLTEAQDTRLAAYLDIINTFVAANTYPPQDLDTFSAAQEVFISAQPSASCEAASDPGIVQLMTTITSPDFERFLGQMLAEPRLPVSNPCF